LEAARRGLRALTRFARFCDRIRVNALAEVKRGVLERYLADLQTGMTSAQRIGMHIGQLNNFLHAVRKHGWDDTLPATALLFPDDHPKRAERPPRALTEQVMAQVEHPDNLDRWDNPAHRLVTLIHGHRPAGHRPAAPAARLYRARRGDPLPGEAPCLRHRRGLGERRATRLREQRRLPRRRELREPAESARCQVAEHRVPDPEPRHAPPIAATTPATSARRILNSGRTGAAIRDIHGTPRTRSRSHEFSDGGPHPDQHLARPRPGLRDCSKRSSSAVPHREYTTALTCHLPAMPSRIVKSGSETVRPEPSGLEPTDSRLSGTAHVVQRSESGCGPGDLVIAWVLGCLLARCGCGTTRRWSAGQCARQVPWR
jgi:hypothetical protein